MVCGVATAGIPHGAILADRLNLPFSYVRASAKSHGRQNQIEGEIPLGSNILVIEDLISTGGSSLEAVEVLKNNNHKVEAVFAIFNYGFDIAKQNFKSADCPFYSLTNYSALLKEAVESNYITTDEKIILSNWSDDPSNWYNNNYKN